MRAWLWMRVGRRGEIPAFAGMTWVVVGMTWVGAGMAGVSAGMMRVVEYDVGGCGNDVGGCGYDEGKCGNDGRWIYGLGAIYAKKANGIEGEGSVYSIWSIW